MAFQRVSIQRTYFKYPECKKGDILVNAGIFIKTEDGKFGPQHIFREKVSGKEVCLNSSGHLNYQLEEHVTPGDLCNVIYDGKVLLTKGTFAGKEAHNFIVEVDPAAKTVVPKADTVSAPVNDITL